MKAARGPRDSFALPRHGGPRPFATPRATYALQLVEEKPEKVGYLMKERVGRIEQLLDAVQRVAAGECVVDRAVVDELLERRRREDPIAELTPREREILGLMAEGRSNQGIGRAPGSARRRSRRTSAARSRSSGSRKRRRTIAACSPCSPRRSSQEVAAQVRAPRVRAAALAAATCGRARAIDLSTSAIRAAFSAVNA